MNTFYSGEERCLKLTQFWPLGPPQGPHRGYVYHLNNFASPTPKHDPYQVCLNPIMTFEEDENVNILWTTDVWQEQMAIADSSMEDFTQVSSKSNQVISHSSCIPMHIFRLIHQTNLSYCKNKLFAFIMTSDLCPMTPEANKFIVTLVCLYVLRS